MKTNKILICVICFLFVIFIGCSCNKQAVEQVKVYMEENVTNLSDVFPLEVVFASGAGGWGTTITIMEDGTFKGEYHDSEMGSSGENYESTVYECSFDGKFKFIEQINEYSYSVELIEINTEKEEGIEEIRDGILHIASKPYGLEDGEKFILYTPDAPLNELPKEFLSWWPKYYNIESYDTISCYGLHNLKTDYGFFSAQ